MGKRHYGLFTATTMLVGIVIGSGIFFRSDDVLVATGGSVARGVLVFCIAAFAIVFGGLTINNLAQLTDKPGGMITYAEEFAGKRFAAAFGWFQIFIYFPTLAVVVSWVAGIYISMLFGLGFALVGHIFLGFAWFAICFLFNIVSARMGGGFQNFSTIVKLIPLIVIGVLGVIIGDPVHAFTYTASYVSEHATNIGWLAAIAPVSFSFAGWEISTTVSSEVRDSKKNMPRALVAAPLIILFMYLIYFIGLSGLIGPSTVMELGDDSVYRAATELFGAVGARIALTFIVISVMGTVNGIILGYVRLPYAMALKGFLPGATWFSKTKGKENMPVISGLFAVVVALFWWIIHYFTQLHGVLGGANISDIAIAVSYLLFAVLYFQVFRLWRKGVVKGIRNGVIFPTLATLGSGFILMGGLQNRQFFIYVFICLIALVAGYVYFMRREK
ncbi:MAG: APC family permease [Lachnospiraceae bacterium]|nr:APC family permease [Lachnospiraceae bacterium]